MGVARDGATFCRIRARNGRAARRSSGIVRHAQRAVGDGDAWQPHWIVRAGFERPGDRPARGASSAALTWLGIAGDPGGGRQDAAGHRRRNQSPATPATSSEGDVALAAREYALLVRWYIEPLLLGRYPVATDLPVCDVVQAGDLETIAQPLDFLGINYYTRIWSSTANPPVPAPNARGISDMGWENCPKASPTRRRPTPSSSAIPLPTRS